MLRSRHTKKVRTIYAQKGFTLIELMVTVSILAILAALAVPSFTPLIERWRMRQITEELQSTLYYARAEAIKRGGNITIARTLTETGCRDISASPSLWDCGWQVFFTTPGTSTTTQLQKASAPSRTHIQIRDSQGNAINASTPISIDRWGQITLSTSTNFNFLISPDSSSSTDTAKLCIFASGRIKRLNTGSESCS
ncbi:GspH/FimT family pseudopilin [Comamonas testosteroni]|uniref:GspH/FimT family pseudopilin n=1 Tax=Comamonas testosteroni TaxID=285 RepID=UPI0009B866D1|nr:GspH/FimT family pseudopilin [Comamonas testosteroni]